MRIEDYALVGDCETAALVGRDGSVDWLCWPRFDSEACFAALLGTREHGRWLVAPVGEARTTRRYLPDTLVLETRHECPAGTVVVLDFMPPRSTYSDFVRLVVGERGTVRMRSELVLRFGYGASVPWVTHCADGALRAIAGPDLVLLRTPAEMHGEGLTTVGEFDVRAGDRVPFVLAHGASHAPPPPAIDAERALEDTVAFWREWLDASEAASEWSGHVRRSLITLKALTYAPTGGIVAAPTTSLPELPGGPRNWDYRYCWLRDATLTLLALMNAGFYAEAAAWRDWLLRAVAGSPEQLQIMYGIAGERRLTELELDWLPGYEGSRPVRLGNGAHDQLQLDVYGEVMDALHQARVGGLPESPAAWSLQRALLRHLEGRWAQPDEGLWEVRGARRHFTYSKAMAWVAFDRGIQSAERFGLDGPVDAWRHVRDLIHADVCERGWNAALGTFTQAYGGTALDASLLLLPQVGFLPPTDPRIVSTVAAIERELCVDGLVIRYDTSRVDDGLPPGEGAFLACSFWLADAWCLLGRQQDARRLYGRLLALANDVGLLAEEYDPVARRQLGNFPQAFSHVALVNTAHNLGLATKPAEQRARGQPAHA